MLRLTVLMASRGGLENGGKWKNISRSRRCSAVLPFFSLLFFSPSYKAGKINSTDAFTEWLSKEKRSVKKPFAYARKANCRKWALYSSWRWRNEGWLIVPHSVLRFTQWRWRLNLHNLPSSCLLMIIFLTCCLAHVIFISSFYDGDNNATTVAFHLIFSFEARLNSIT